ncbi:LysR substrate-binding domain-containing protein [Variovorax sp. Sphag1AA]|uniref:LysR substrate-binding domain-containing protein n=1 Tax=Variovorax sp. Sphag1AA TaxID=2587027 RepID=UPI0017A4CFA6|nr:LysR substrate-binding domain-containing protein [Variovorax sp. Sphag1AA]MBB3182080.1 DNA-binding transcriptional LysR family regulator [Variovorax sp. Sphag1AA]
MPITFQQLQCVRQVVESGFSVSRAAESLHTTQPGVSKMIRLLEKEIGVELFTRAGNRLTGLTEPGKEALSLCARVLQDAQALRRLKQDSPAESEGTLRVGTTHIHARYSLIEVTRRFLAVYPQVKLEFTIGPPSQILAGVTAGTIDIGLCTLPDTVPKGVVSVKAYDIDRCLIVPPRHPLLKMAKTGRVTMEQIARWPLITYDSSFTSGSVVQGEFRRHGITPWVVMRAMDASIIKAYVAAGVGVAVLQKMAFSARLDKDLRAIPVDHLFPSSSAMISLRRDHLLKKFAFDFIQMVAPEWSREAIDAQLQ